MKLLKKIVFWIFGLIAVLALTIAVALVFGFVQGSVFGRGDYIMGIFNFPASRLIFIFEICAVLLLFYVYNRIFKRDHDLLIFKIKGFISSNRKWTYPVFAALYILLIYTIFFNITVIYKDKIIDYSFISPMGRQYSYSDIKEINTGVYGKGYYFPFTHSAGDFYYKIKFSSGKVVDINDSIAGTKDDKDIYLLFEEFDKRLVDMGIPKTAKMDNFNLCAKSLDKEYTDRIKTILNNIN